MTRPRTMFDTARRVSTGETETVVAPTVVLEEEQLKRVPSEVEEEGTRKYRCDMCDKEYKSEAALKRHTGLKHE